MRSLLCAAVAVVVCFSAATGQEKGSRREYDVLAEYERKHGRINGGQQYQARVTELDLRRGSVKLGQNPGVTLALTAKTKFTIDGKDAPLKKLARDMLVRVTLTPDGKKTAARIDAFIKETPPAAKEGKK